MPVITSEQPPMADPIPGEEHLQTVTVRIRADLARMIRTMCAGLGQKQAVVDYLDEKLRDVVLADYEEFKRQLAAEDTSKSRPSRRKRKED